MKFKNPATCAALALGIALLSSPSAYADVILTYTGNDFTRFTSPYTGTDKVTASITLANPLGDNLNLDPVTPLAFSFNDGVQTLTNHTPNILAFPIEFSTDMTGRITAWNISVAVNGPSSQRIITENNPPPLSVADVASSAIGVFAANATSPGSWSATTAAVPNAPALRLIKIIPIDGTAGDRSTKLFSFDISWFDETTGLYFLADRSNAALDVVDTTGAFTGKPETLFGQIGANPAFQRGFAGDTGNSATSGPNGVTVSPNKNVPCIFATDGPSLVVSFNYSVSFTALVSTINTGGNRRADELAFDPKDNLLLVINNAEVPPSSPFGTLIRVSANCGLSLELAGPLLKKIPFSTIGATNGAEQPVWDPTTQRFYVSIPEINGPGDGTGPHGGVARIAASGTSGVIETVYPINFMQPADLTLGPNDDLLIGSNSVFDTAGRKCTAVVPSPNPSGTTAGAPDTCNGIAFPQVAICNPSRGCSPSNGSLVSVAGIGGGDEVWFNPGDKNYYVTAGNDPVGPVFGVVESVVNTLTQLVPTLPPVPATNPATPPGHSAGTVHSIAASNLNNHVYVPLPANTAYSDSSGTNCAQGCIAVFSAQ